MATVDQLALLSKSSYGGNNVTIPSGWVQLPIGDPPKDYFTDERTGFAGALYGHVSSVTDGVYTYDEVVMAIRGTEHASISAFMNDIADDFAIMRGDSFSQKDSLSNFYDAVDGTLADLELTSTAKTYITGQSLGGTLAERLGSEHTDIETVTFDSFGAQYLTEVCKPYSNITNYVVANDPVGTYYLDGHLGNVVLLYPVPMDDGALGALAPHNYIPFYNDLSISNFIIPNGAANWSKEQGLALWFYDKNMNDTSEALAIVKGFAKPSLSVLDSAVGYIESLKIHPVTLTYNTGDGYYVIGSDMSDTASDAIVGKDQSYDTSGFLITGNDKIWGNGGNDVINGLGGNDTIYGGDGADTIHGGDGNDLIYGGNNGSAEILTSVTGNSIYGDAGNDTIYGGGAGNDYLDGGAGNDTIHAVGSKSATIFGGADNDSIIGASGNDIINGGDGSDTIRGNDGKDSKNIINGNFSRLSSLKGA